MTNLQPHELTDDWLTYEAVGNYLEQFDTAEHNDGPLKGDDRKVQRALVKLYKRLETDLSRKGLL